MMGGVTVVITSMLLLLWFLDNPYHSGVGGLPPTAMQRTLELLDEEAKIVGLQLGQRCDERGVRADAAASTAHRCDLGRLLSGGLSSRTAVRIAQITNAVALR